MTADKTDSLLTEISNKLDTLIRLYSIGLVKDIKLQKDQISVLDEAGFEPKQIADILGTTRNTVSVALNAIKKERLAKERKETAKEETVKPTEVEAKTEEKKQE
jgi:transcriptional regulator